MRIPVDISTLIERRPRVKGGRPTMTGTGMSVHRVAALFLAGMTAEQIQSEYPDVPLGHIHAALAYYHANRAEIDGYLKDDADAFSEGYRLQQASRVKPAV